MRTLNLICLFLSATFLLHAADDSVRIDADFPGGNIRVVRQEGKTFTLAPDLRDIQKGQWWFYFNFRLRAPAGEHVTIVFDEKNPIGVRGPALSTDAGMTWKWLGADAVTGRTEGGKTSWSFVLIMPKDAADVRCAFAPQYLDAHFQAWLATHKDDPALRVSDLCRSRKGRPVPLVTAGCLDDAKTRGLILLTSRHHACESVATYALEGILDSALATDDVGRQFRERWRIVALPFADRDGVEDGDQGKNRAPHDHNRDYNAQPLYPEVAAWMKLGEAFKGRVAFTLDLHCPYIRGTSNDRVYLVGGAHPEFQAREKEFAMVLERTRTGPLPFSVKECYLPSGTSWNTAANFTAGRSCGAWSRDTFPEARFSGTLEIAYADAQGAEVTATAARALGRDLAHAILEQIGK